MLIQNTILVIHLVVGTQLLEVIETTWSVQDLCDSCKTRLDILMWWTMIQRNEHIPSTCKLIAGLVLNLSVDVQHEHDRMRFSWIIPCSMSSKAHLFSDSCGLLISYNWLHMVRSACQSIPWSKTVEVEELRLQRRTHIESKELFNLNGPKGFHTGKIHACGRIHKVLSILSFSASAHSQHYWPWKSRNS